MIGKILAVCGWLAWQVGRGAGAIRQLSPDVRRYAANAVGGLLLFLALLPFVLPIFDAQPENVTVQQILDGRVSNPGAWVRLSGTTVALPTSPTGEDGTFGILADARNPLRSIVVKGDLRPAIDSPDNVTGHLATAVVAIDPSTLPIEATVAGTPPRIVDNRLLELDGAPKAPGGTLWPLSILPLILGAMLLIGARAGYPIFRESFEIDVLVAPLGVGERIPAAYGGRLGDHRRDLADPGAALLMVRRRPKGNVLTAQPIPDNGGPEPAPVPIGGGWTSGRLGYVYTVNETVPAITVVSEEVDATILFAKTTERDRIAALIAIGR